MTHNLLAELVAAYEASSKYVELRAALLSKYPSGCFDFRSGDYNISIAATRYGGRAVTVGRVTVPDPTIEYGVHGGYFTSCHSAPEEAPIRAKDLSEAPAANINPESCRRTVETLTTAFIWRNTSEGSDYWADVARRLRAYGRARKSAP
jgi:hypothetical protein